MNFSRSGRAGPIWKSGSTWKTASAWKGFLNTWKGCPYLENWFYLKDCLFLERLSQYLEGLAACQDCPDPPLVAGSPL
jgi:hypothetical protein